MNIRLGILPPCLRVLAAAVITGGALGSLARAEDPEPSETELEIVRLQKSWGPALVRGDIAVLDRLEADDWAGVDPSGHASTKAASLQAVREGHYRATQFRCEEIAVRLFGETAIVSVRSSVEATYDGQDCGGIFRFTDVWVRRRGLWQCVASHATRMPAEETGPAGPAGRPLASVQQPTAPPSPSPGLVRSGPAPGSGTPGPEPYRFRVGAIEAAVLYDGGFAYAPADLFFTAPAGAVAAARRARGDAAEKITLAYAGLLLCTPTNRILVDTGVGGWMGPGQQHLLESLGRAGLTPDQIDTVILTHAHLDHIGGTLRPDGTPAFAKARYVMFRQEWDFWLGDHPDLSGASVTDADRRQFVEIARKQLLPLRPQIELVEHDGMVRPGVFAILAAGHTPGLMVIRVESQGRTLFCLSDLVLDPLTLEHPDWCPRYDGDVALARAARRRVLALAAERPALVYATHFPWPGLGSIRAVGDHWIWNPAAE